MYDILNTKYQYGIYSKFLIEDFNIHRHWNGICLHQTYLCEKINVSFCMYVDKNFV
jgi:hypothetical protein